MISGLIDCLSLIKKDGNNAITAFPNFGITKDTVVKIWLPLLVNISEPTADGALYA